MKATVVNKKYLVGAGIVMLVLIASPVVYSHCQIPCGIYGDDTRFDMMAEHITTIEKSMKMINQISAEDKPNMNQLVRWVNNKEAHADELSNIITYYFMAQRVKPVEKAGGDGYGEYVGKITLLHKMLVSSMKAKQSTDLAVIGQLREQLDEFRKAYYGEHEHEHQH